jgi:hypothetical protein
MKGRDDTAAADNFPTSKSPPKARCATIEIAILLQRPTHLVTIATEITAIYITFINMDEFTVIPTLRLEILHPETLAMLRRFVAMIA